MEILIKYFEIVALLVIITNAFILKNTSKIYISEKPELKEGYDKLFKGIIIYFSIPLIIIVVGNLSGSTNGMSDYLNPTALNPFVVIFNASIIILWILGIRWIYFKNGAEFLEQHSVLFNKYSGSKKKNFSAKKIEYSFTLMLLGGIVAMIMMWV